MTTNNLPTTPGVYLIELEQPLNNRRRDARYYLGSAKNIAKRIAKHRTSEAAAFVREANRRNIGWTVALVIPCQTEQEARRLEAQIKRQKRNYGRLLNKTITA